MSTVNETTEYAIKVGDRGYLGDQLPMLKVIVPHLDSGETNFETVNSQAVSLARTYRQMGCPEIADEVEIIKRTVTVTRGDQVTVVPVRGN